MTRASQVAFHPVTQIVLLRGGPVEAGLLASQLCDLGKWLSLSEPPVSSVQWSVPGCGGVLGVGSLWQSVHEALIGDRVALASFM